MIIKSSALAAVSVRKEQYPPEDRKEIAFAGRSNVGKSSLLNLLTGRKSLAKVSGNPGKTRTINFYDILARPDGVDHKSADTGRLAQGDPEKQTPEGITELRFRIVDLPGYGYAKVAKSLSENWGDMIEAYLRNRKTLVCAVLLLDIRHNPTAQDIQMYEWLKYYGLNGFLAITKADKVSAGERVKCIKNIKDTLGLGEADKLFPVSTLKKTGVVELLTEMEERIKCNS
jgi:GTP-binding protein